MHKVPSCPRGKQTRRQASRVAGRVTARAPAPARSGGRAARRDPRGNGTAEAENRAVAVAVGAGDKDPHHDRLFARASPDPPAAGSPLHTTLTPSNLPASGPPDMRAHARALPPHHSRRPRPAAAGRPAAAARRSAPVIDGRSCVSGDAFASVDHGRRSPPSARAGTNRDKGGTGLASHQDQARRIRRHIT